jgi:hypothetical protein
VPSFGFCILFEDQIAECCNSFYVGRGISEVDIIYTLIEKNTALNLF